MRTADRRNGDVTTIYARVGSLPLAKNALHLPSRILLFCSRNPPLLCLDISLCLFLSRAKGACVQGPPFPHTLRHGSLTFVCGWSTERATPSNSSAYEGLWLRGPASHSPARLAHRRGCSVQLTYSCVFTPPFKPSYRPEFAALCGADSKNCRLCYRLVTGPSFT